MHKRVLAAVALCLGLLMLPLVSDSAFAQKRVALVIGNGSYQNVAKLPNPIKDAVAVTDMFRKAGFDWVKMSQDVGNLDFKRALREFMDAATDADIAVVYYAGHGIQVRDMNYMIPVDARLATEIDAEDEAVSLDRIVAALEPAKRLRLVILDACRDNPFQRTMKRRVATRAVSGGLAKMEPMLGDTLIAYAAKAGSTADDGDGAHSPFAAALVKHLAVPGLDVRLAFGRVRDEVLKATAYKQEPFVYGSLGGESIAIVPAPGRAARRRPFPSRRATTSWSSASAPRRRGKSSSTPTRKASTPTSPGPSCRSCIQAEQVAVATPAPAAAGEPKITLAAVEPTQAPKPPEPSGEDRRAWTRVNKDDTAKLRDFIDRYPASPLAEQAKNRIDILDRAAQEREEKARVEREAKAAEAARKAAEAERLKAEREAALRREAEERQAKAAEAERQKAEREAAKQREAELRQATLRREAEERQAKAANEAERLKAEREAKAAEAARKAAEAERIKAEREAAKQREAQERQAKAAAEAERVRAEAERVRAEREAARQREETERQAKAAEAERQKAAEQQKPPSGTAESRRSERKRSRARHQAGRPGLPARRGAGRPPAGLDQPGLGARGSQAAAGRDDLRACALAGDCAAVTSASRTGSTPRRAAAGPAGPSPREPAANTPELIRWRRTNCGGSAASPAATTASSAALPQRRSAAIRPRRAIPRRRPRSPRPSWRA